MVQLNEKQAFATRLRAALQASGVRVSPTVVAHEFNLRYWGRGITPHTARNWLLGNALPMQDKLQVLAQWLQVAPQELRFGSTAALIAQEVDPDFRDLNMVDREMLKRYLSLTASDRKTVRDVVAALVLAAQVRSLGETIASPQMQTQP